VQQPVSWEDRWRCVWEVPRKEGVCWSCWGVDRGDDIAEDNDNDDEDDEYVEEEKEKEEADEIFEESIPPSLLSSSSSTLLFLFPRYFDPAIGCHCFLALGFFFRAA